MTGPLGVGFQDWGRSFATSRFFNEVYASANVTVDDVTGPYTTVNIDSIGVKLQGQTNTGQLFLFWCADELGTIILTQDVISIRQAQIFEQSIVVKGPFLYVTAAPGPAANWTLSLLLYETTRSVVPQITATWNVLFGSASTAVGAGATVTFELQQLFAGEIAWHGTSGLATWTARLETIDDAGVLGPVDFMDNTSPKAPRTVFLPACTIRLALQNTTGAAGNIGARVTARPGLSGM